MATLAISIDLPPTGELETGKDSSPTVVQMAEEKQAPDLSRSRLAVSGIAAEKTSAKAGERLPCRAARLQGLVAVQPLSAARYRRYRGNGYRSGTVGAPPRWIPGVVGGI